MATAPAYPPNHVMGSLVFHLSIPFIPQMARFANASRAIRTRTFACAVTGRPGMRAR